MTEAEWLATGEPEPALEWIAPRASARAVRLFAAACCRRVWSLLESDPRRAVRAAERYADATMGRTGLAVCRGAAFRDAQIEALYEAIWAGRAAWQVTWADAGRGARRVLRNVLRVRDYQLQRPALRRRERRYLSHLLRDVFGNPFRPIVFLPSWRTDTALTLARTMYDARDFSAMPILADALQDAGCGSAELLDHCRGPGPHVRGCWAVDLVLGKA